MINKIVIFTIFAALLLSAKTNAQLYAFTDHQVVKTFEQGVESERFPTGELPYIGRVGLEYERKRMSYTLSFIHRSNVDLWSGDEYNYNGVAMGVKFRHCIADC